MGKVRVKTLGGQELEENEQKKTKQRQEKKRTVKAPGLKGGERVAAVGPTEEEIEKQISQEKQPEEIKTEEKLSVVKSASGRKRVRSKSYREKLALVDKKNKYGVSDALDLIEKMPASGWDETVELHVNTVRTGQFGSVMLPHGTGKKIRVAIADEEILSEIEKGKIDFDVLLASPEMMPKLARVAKFLGPKGLMPNPKNGTISKNPKEAAKQFEAGQLTIKTEGKFPIVHLAVGKVSFGKEKLEDNIEAVLDLIKAQNIQSATLKSTMSPGVKIQI